ncbi:MAG: LPS-assembly protein LptD [Acidobacteriaceae bacterium]
MRTRVCICITLLAFCHAGMSGQALAKKLPPAQPAVNSSGPASSVSVGELPNAPGVPNIPVALVVPSPPAGVPVTIHARQQEKQGDTYTLRGEIEIDYQDYVVRADHATYNSATGEVKADGHLQVTGGPDNENFSATHGTMNLNAQTGHFYDVIGSVGVVRASTNVYTTANPFIMSGKELIKKGPDNYVLLKGSMTSCRIPKPHWRILAPRIQVNDTTAKAWNARFHLLRYPILYLPYVTHAVDSSGRQSGLLIPAFSPYDNIKGTVIGEAYYWAINRSTDLMLGLQYYSLRGFEQSAEFRFRGRGNDFLHGLYNGLEDRGLAPLYINQGGQDTLVMGRHDLTPYTRVVTNAEYLSSYTYRQVFAPSFSLAVSSEVKSWAFLTHEKNGLSSSLDFERYQNYASDLSGDQVRILHVPTIEFDTVDHSLARSSVFAGGDASAAILSRSEPYYIPPDVGRIDLFPHLSKPFISGGWTFRPIAGVRETLYSSSQNFGPVPSSPQPPLSSASSASLPLPGQNAVPTSNSASLTRNAVEVGAQVLPPVLMRDYAGPFLAKHLGVAFRHSVEPELNYRFVAGVNNFNSVPRFDPIDIYSDTNEVEYGLTQRLFLKRLHPKPCDKDPVKAKTEKDCGEVSREWLTWFLGQKFFADPTFGGAVIAGRRNVFTSTLDFSGVAYITSPRSFSPIVSRFRANTSANTDMEWDFDYDTKAGRVAASNIFANYRRGNFFTSFSHAYLNAVGETPVPPSQPPNVVNFNQMQLMLGHGALTKPGLSAAASGGLDLNLRSLEYATVQTNYNFDCCGFAVEYRDYSLGPIRNEHMVSFSFTLAGVASAGNLKRSERLF